MALRPRLSPGVPLSRWVATVGSGTAAVKHLLLTAVEGTLRTLPDDDQLHSLRGVALAYLGRRAETVRAGQRGVALMTVSKDAYWGVYNQLQLARIYILTGQYEEALDQLEALLKIPCYLSPGWLKIDPTFDQLRGNPRFERLVNSQ